MGPCNHTRADRMLIARVSGLARHRDTDHRDRWNDVVRRLRDVTTDPHLLAHAADGRDGTDELLALAGADMEAVAAIRARGVQDSGLGGMADRSNREIREQQKAPRTAEAGGAQGEAG